MIRELATPQYVINFLFLYKTRRLVTGRMYVNAIGDSVVVIT